MAPNRGNDAPIAGIVDGSRQVVSEFRKLEAPVTRSVVFVVLGVFVGQVLAALLVGVRIPVLVRSLFAEYPAVAWTLSPVLHYGALHFLFNIVAIWGVGAIVEQTLSRKRYAALILIAAVGSTAASYLAKAPFASVQMATYGSSGIAYAVATYSIGVDSKNPVSRPRDLASLDAIAYLAGLVAILLVTADIVAGPYATANWFNGSHLGGAVIGLVAGGISRIRNSGD